MPLILGTNSIKDTGYEVANSLRFNPGSSDGLTRSTNSPTSRRKFTFSTWFKKSDTDISDNQALLSITDGGNYFFDVRFQHSNEELNVIDYQDGTQMYLQTNLDFKDDSAWTHIVVQIDTTHGSPDNRMRIYVNGVEETSFSSRTNPSTNHDTAVNQTNTRIGFQNNQYYFDGYLAETVFLDGLDHGASFFGEFDDDTGIWIPKDVTDFTFGNNGFYLDYENSSNLGADASGEGHNFTVNNLTSIDQSTDTCTNNAMTINRSYYSASSYTLTNGNLAVDGNASNAWRSLYGTFGLTSGKWYWEIKIDGKESSDPNNFAIGIVSSEQVDQSSSNGKFFGTAQGYAYHGKDGKKLNNDTVTANGASYGDSFTTGNIIGVFLDLDNHKLYFSKDGVVQASGDPTSGSTGTNAAFSITSGHTYFPAIANYYSAEHYSFNFVSPPFSITSGNQDGNGYGNFEYPTQGYYACNTKNLAEFG